MSLDIRIAMVGAIAWAPGAVGRLRAPRYLARELRPMYVSRTDRFVLVRLRAGRSLLLTLAEPERFLAALQSAAAA